MTSSDEFEIDDVAETEVELTAQDLLDLSPLPIAAHTSPSATSIQSEIPSAVVAAAASAAPLAASSRIASPVLLDAKKASRSTIVFGVCAIALVIAVAAGVGVVFSKDSSPIAAAPAVRSTIPLKPDPYIEEPAPEQPPVLVKNPFDETEVFELPPGTSKADARAYVADLLLKRAAERSVSN